MSHCHNAHVFLLLEQYRLEVFERTNFQTFQEGASLLLGKGFMCTVDPIVIKHMLRTNFNDFNKFQDGSFIGWVYADTFKLLFFETQTRH